MHFHKPVAVRWVIVISLFVGATLMTWWTIVPGTHAQDQSNENPQQKRDIDTERKKVEAKAAKEFQDVQAVFAGKPVTIFSKDAGPREGVAILKVVEFRGVEFLHLQDAKDGKNYLICNENITLIRED